MLSPPTVWRFSVAADINGDVFYYYFLIWSLSRLLCCVGSGFSVAAALVRLSHQLLTAVRALWSDTVLPSLNLLYDFRLPPRTR